MERQVASLKEQRCLLEEQAATLQRQVDGLVEVRWRVGAMLAGNGVDWAGRTCLCVCMPVLP